MESPSNSLENDVVNFSKCFLPNPFLGEILHSTRMQNILSELTELGHSTTERLSRGHTMNNKNVPNNVKCAYGVPYLIFEYKPIKFGRKHMKSEGRAFAYHFRMSSNVKFIY